MKKSISLLLGALLLTFLMIGCSPVDTTVTEVGYLSGSTGVGMAKMITDEKDNPNYSFTLYGSAQDMVTALLAEGSSIDIAALPTNAAAQIYNKTNGRYQVVALNTLGVLYLASNGVEITSLQELIGKTVYVPEVAPGYILQHVLAQNGIHVKTGASDTEEGVTISYAYDLNSLPGAFLAGNNQDGENVEIILMPEPKMTAIKKQAAAQNKTVNVLFDMTEEWNKVSDHQLVQGCIVASSEYIKNHKSALQSFLTKYKASIEYMENSDNLADAAKLVTDLTILPSIPVATAAIPNCHLCYIDGADMKATLSAYLHVLYEQNPAAIGGKLPDDAFYYIAK